MNKAIVSRRQFLTLSGATGGAVLLAACAPVGAPSGGMDEGAADAGGGAEEMITISWSWWGSEEQLERQEAKLGAFKEANPSVDVESVFVGWREYPTKILTMYAGGTAPDAIECDAYWAPDWFSRRMAVHLDPLLDADPDASRDDYVEHFLPDMTVDGNLYGLPTDAGPMIWQYNTDVIGESGMPTPLEYYEQGEWNWDSFVELGNAVTDKEANIYFHTSFYSWAYWMPMAWTFGGSMFNEDVTQCTVDSEAFITALQYTLELKDVHEIMPAPGTASDLGLNFRSGNVGMMSAWSRQPLNRAVSLGGNDKVQPCFVAAGPEGAKCITKSNNEFVSSQSDYTDLAYDLIKMITGPEGEWVQHEEYKFIYPATRKNYDNPEYWAMSAWDQLGIQEVSQVEHGHLLPITHKIPWTQMSSIWSQYTDQVWLGDLTAAEACAGMAADINKVIEEAS